MHRHVVLRQGLCQFAGRSRVGDQVVELVQPADMLEGLLRELAAVQHEDRMCRLLEHGALDPHRGRIEIARAFSIEAAGADDGVPDIEALEIADGVRPAHPALARIVFAGAHADPYGGIAGQRRGNAKAGGNDREIIQFGGKALCHKHRGAARIDHQRVAIFNQRHGGLRQFHALRRVGPVPVIKKRFGRGGSPGCPAIGAVDEARGAELVKIPADRFGRHLMLKRQFGNADGGRCPELRDNGALSFLLATLLDSLHRFNPSPIKLLSLVFTIYNVANTTYFDWASEGARAFTTGSALLDGSYKYQQGPVRVADRQYPGRQCCSALTCFFSPGEVPPAAHRSAGAPHDRRSPMKP